MVKKRTLYNLTIQFTISALILCVSKQQSKGKTEGNYEESQFSQASVSFKISNLLICFCSFDLSCPILEKDNFMLLSCLIKLRSFITVFVSIRYSESARNSVHILSTLEHRIM